jgi:hypothetical protein
MGNILEPMVYVKLLGVSSLVIDVTVTVKGVVFGKYPLAG